MSENEPKNSNRIGGLLLGGALIVLGILFLFGQWFRVDIGHYVWPLLIIVPGVAMLVAALSTATASSEGLAIGGSLVTVVGLILLYQNMTGYWATWAYAWALVAPTSIGLGQLMYGAARNRPALVKSGTRVAAIGGIIFLAGAFFFELVIGLSGFGLGRYGLPALLIVLGLVLLAFNFWPRHKQA